MSADNYIRFEPNVVQVDHFAVNVSEDTVENLNLESTQYMIVGEHVSSSGSNLNKSYSLIVDHEGVAINTSIPDRRNALSEYALYVEGDVFVNGTIQSSLGGGFGSSSVGIGGTGNYWQLIQNPNSNSIIYWNGRAVLGNRAHASNTTNTLKIVESAERNIDHAQIAIQNTQNSIFNMAILGTSRESPAVINTTSRTPIEFHANRRNDYFSRLYSNMQVPKYKYDLTSNIYDAPHLCIDVNGNVGIRTSCNVDIRYSYIDSHAVTHDVKQAPNLFVNGVLFSSNIVIFDPQTETIDNIDNIYVRQRGIWVEASNVNSGTFPGIYAFSSNITVNHPSIRYDYNLYVDGNAKFESDIVVEGESRLSDVLADKFVSYYDASFSNNVFVERDVTVNETLRVKGQIQTLYHINGSNVWCNIDFRPQNIDYANLNIRTSGDVLSTPFKFGIGINQLEDQVENSLVVQKRIPNIYQLELSDKSRNQLERFAAIGHFQTDLLRSDKDGSLIFTTGNQYDTRFNNTGLYNMRQNIYFYPGDYVDQEKTLLPMIREGNPPTLGIFTKTRDAITNILRRGRVGIHTYEPRAELDVYGDIAVSGRFLFTDVNGALQPIGKWLSTVNADASVQNSSLYTRGLYYIENDAPHVGINVPPEFPYGLSVEGGIKSYGGYFTKENEEIIPWLRPSSTITIPSVQQSIYTAAKVGVGVTNVQYPLEIASQYNKPAFVAIHRGGINNESGLLFVDDNNSWTLQANKNDNSIQLMRYATPSSNIALWSRLNNNNNHQVFIAADSNVIYSNNYDDSAVLTVGGNMHVVGTINATGGYRFNGQVMINAAIDGDFPDISTDDVFIGGNTVHVRPNNTSYMSIGYTDQFMRSVFNSTTAVLRVYQSVSTRTAIARFISRGSTGFIDIMNENNKGLRLGVIDNTVRMLDVGSGDAFLTFASDPTNIQNRFVGINTTAPTANLHVISSRSGNNMFRLTRISTVDAADIVASINLEKRIQISDSDPNAQFFRWSFLGPNPLFEQKLTLNYAEQNTIQGTIEKFCFTNNGSIGVLTPTPQYAIDIACGGKHGSIRMFSKTSNVQDIPQLIFQSGNNVFGQTADNDYRFYAASNTFVFEQANESLQVPIKLLSCSKSGKVGIRHAFTEAEDNDGERFQCFIGGNLNVTKGIFLNGRQLFSVDDTTSTVGVYLRENDVILNPRRGFENGVTEWGGVNINYTQSTCNLFYIAGENSANMMVLDSGLPKVQMHFMHTNAGSLIGSIYRLETEHDVFRLSQRQNVNTTEKYISDSSNEYLTAYEIEPYLNNASRFKASWFGDMEFKYPDTTLQFSSNATLAVSDSSVTIDFSTQNDGLVVVQRNPLGATVSTALLALSNVDYPSATTVVTRDGRVRIGAPQVQPRLDAYRFAVSGGILSYGNILPGANTFTLGTSIDRWNNIWMDANAQINMGNVKVIQNNNEIQCKNISETGENFVAIRLKEFIMDANEIDRSLQGIQDSTAFYYSLTPDPTYKLLVKETNRYNNISTPYAPLWKNLDGNFYNFEVSLSTGEFDTVPSSKFYVYNTSNIPTVNFESSRGSVFYIDATDNIGIGTTLPSVAYENNVQFQFNQIGSFEEDVAFKKNVDIALDCVVHGDITNDSDLRIKKDLQKIEGALDKVSQLTGYTFTRLHDNARSTGLVAQEIKEVLPEVVRENEEGIYSVAYGNMMGLIVEAIKDLRAELRELRDFIGYQS